VAIYNDRLTERRRRREFVQAHALLDVKPQQVTESKTWNLNPTVNGHLLDRMLHSH